MTTTYTPRVYVGTYAKYNNGSIAGAWLDLEAYADQEDFLEACEGLHKDESDPEFMFQDYEDIPEGMRSESTIEPELWDWIDLDDSDKELLFVFREHMDSSGTIEQAGDSYQGTYSSPEDWAEEFLDDCGGLEGMPENLRGYFDYSAYARDCGYEGMTFARHGGDVWVFNGNY